MTTRGPSLDGTVVRYAKPCPHCAQTRFSGMRERSSLPCDEESYLQPLTALPGAEITSENCGGVSGPLMAFGLVLASADRTDKARIAKCQAAARRFSLAVPKEVGSDRVSPDTGESGGAREHSKGVPRMSNRTHRTRGRPMRTWSGRFAAGLFALGMAAVTVAVSPDASAQASGVDPAAVQKLKQMTTFLDGLQQFSVRTQNTVEDLHVSGHRVDYDLAANVTVKRPNKLHAARVGQLMDQRFFYDGKTLTLHNPAEKVYATKEAPATIERMIDFARETVGILLPAADLLYRNAFPLLMQDVTLAAVVGKAIVGGVKCDHLLFSRPGVDFQVWVTEGKEPWPCKYVVTEMDTPLRLGISTTFSNWNASPAVDDAKFRFVPPKGASAIPFMPPRTPVESGR